MSGRILFHLPASWLGPFGSGLMPFYAALTAGLQARGIAFDLTALDRETLMQQVNSDDVFHIVNHGRFSHPRLLNAGIAYIYPFWNMDPAGIRAFSSIAALPFDPATIDSAQSTPFFRRLKKRQVGARRSRYDQPIKQTPNLPSGAVALFLQSEAHRIVGETCHLTRWQMLDTVLAGWDGPVIVKPHPRDTDPTTQSELAARAARFDNLHVSTGNIHDILAVADRVVTINSAVGIEAYLHRKPLILCGQSDFHHIAQTAHSPDQLRAFLTRPVRKRAYDKFIYWYFAQHCLATTDPALTDRTVARIAAQGYDLS